MYRDLAYQFQTFPTYQLTSALFPTRLATLFTMNPTILCKQERFFLAIYVNKPIKIDDVTWEHFIYRDVNIHRF